MSQAGTTPRRLVALSTASVYPDRTPDAFEVAARLGYDGVEVMVTPDAVSQDVEVLRRLADYHSVPVLAVHAPCLLITQRVWGREPWGKLVRAKDVAEELGARVVVVHPPFRWQREYARDFAAGLARMQDETDVCSRWRTCSRSAPGERRWRRTPRSWNPVPMDYPHVTLDLSHTAVSGSDALAMADELGGRLAHVHLADGTGLANRDEHLVPGRGTQPCAQLLHRLAAENYQGLVVLEVKTFRAATQEARQSDLAEALEFARANLASPGEAPAGDSPGRRPTQARPRPPVPARRAPPAAPTGPGATCRPVHLRPRSPAARFGMTRTGSAPAADHLSTHPPATYPQPRRPAMALDAASTEDACCPS